MTYKSRPSELSGDGAFPWLFPLLTVVPSIEPLGWYSGAPELWLGADMVGVGVGLGCLYCRGMSSAVVDVQ